MPIQVRRRNGFTLVELLVVLAIIAALLALLLPAVNAARESARILQCKTHLRQIGVAAAAYESSQRAFPSGGWSKEWTADPNRGFGKSQPGSWLYSLLPYVEEQSLYDLGAGHDSASDEYRRSNAIRHGTAVRLYHCPSRRPAVAYPHGWRLPCYNCENIPSLPVVAKNDYAANAGDGIVNSGDGSQLGGPYRIPTSYAESDDGFDWVPTDEDDPDSLHFKHIVLGSSISGAKCGCEMFQMA